MQSHLLFQEAHRVLCRLVCKEWQRDVLNTPKRASLKELVPSTCQVLHMLTSSLTSTEAQLGDPSPHSN